MEHTLEWARKRKSELAVEWDRNIFAHLAGDITDEQFNENQMAVTAQERFLLDTRLIELWMNQTK